MKEDSKKFILFFIGICVLGIGIVMVFAGINDTISHHDTNYIVDEKVVSMWNNSINITEFRGHWDNINYGSSSRSAGPTAESIDESMYNLPAPFISHIIEPVEDYSYSTGDAGGAIYTAKYANGTDVFPTYTLLNDTYTSFTFFKDHWESHNKSWAIMMWNSTGSGDISTWTPPAGIAQIRYKVTNGCACNSNGRTGYGGAGVSIIKLEEDRKLSDMKEVYQSNNILKNIELRLNYNNFGIYMK
jgi:hypothetical protein